MFDIDRLWHLRSDVRDMINLDVCSKLFCILLDRAGHNGPATSEMLGSVQQSCLSILEDFDGEARWAEHARSIALEITRSAHMVCGTKHLSVDLEFAERFLTEIVGTGLGCWSQLQKKTETAMWPSLIENVNAYQHMSPLDILNHVEANIRTAPGTVSHELDCSTRRIAHIGMLHWRVWAPLLYMRQKPAKLAPVPKEDRKDRLEDCFDDTVHETWAEVVPEPSRIVPHQYQKA